jgi:hypothetical protein
MSTLSGIVQVSFTHPETFFFAPFLNCPREVRLLEKTEVHINRARQIMLHLVWSLLSDSKEYCNSHSEKK